MESLPFERLRFCSVSFGAGSAFSPAKKGFSRLIEKAVASGRRVEMTMSFDPPEGRPRTLDATAQEPPAAPAGAGAGLRPARVERTMSFAPPEGEPRGREAAAQEPLAEGPEAVAGSGLRAAVEGPAGAIRSAADLRALIAATDALRRPGVTGPLYSAAGLEPDPRSLDDVLVVRPSAPRPTNLARTHQEAEARLNRAFPALRLAQPWLPDKYGVVVAGGAACAAIRFEDAAANCDDVDLFLVGHADDASALEALRFILEWLTAGADGGPCHCHFTAGAITVVIDGIKYQLILRRYRTLAEVPYGFDNGASSVTYSRGLFQTTALGRFAQTSGLNVLTLAARRPTYESRLVKYFTRRGFGVAFPDLPDRPFGLHGPRAPESAVQIGFLRFDGARQAGPFQCVAAGAAVRPGGGVGIFVRRDLDEYVAGAPIEGLTRCAVLGGPCSAYVLYCGAFEASHLLEGFPGADGARRRPIFRGVDDSTLISGAARTAAERQAEARAWYSGPRAFRGTPGARA